MIEFPFTFDVGHPLYIDEDVDNCKIDHDNH
jgi:hypothetical protein